MLRKTRAEFRSRPRKKMLPSASSGKVADDAQACRVNLTGRAAKSQVATSLLLQTHLTELEIGEMLVE